MMFNKKLLNICIPIISGGVDNHDIWMAKIASLCADTIHIPEPTLIHRFHDNNVSWNANSIKFLNRIKRVSGRIIHSKEFISQKLFLTESLKARLDDKVAEYNRETLNKYISLLKSKGKCAKENLYKNNFNNKSKLQNIIFLTQLNIANRKNKNKE